MPAFILSRLLQLVPVVLGMTLLAFALARLIPGDPVETMMGERGIDPAHHAAMRHALGLDRPLAVQYLDYLGGVASGDLGRSLVTKAPVLGEFLDFRDVHVRFGVAPAGGHGTFAIELLRPGLSAAVTGRWAADARRVYAGACWLRP